MANTTGSAGFHPAQCGYSTAMCKQLFECCESDRCKTTASCDIEPSPSPVFASCGLQVCATLVSVGDDRSISLMHPLVCKDFADLRNWTAFLLEQNRPMVFYPETAYWVTHCCHHTLSHTYDLVVYLRPGLKPNHEGATTATTAMKNGLISTEDGSKGGTAYASSLERVKL
eukprot:4982999-Amphidinium_carterae.1